MQTIRRRLTVSYAFALTATMAVFGAALYWDRRQSDILEREAQLEERLRAEANVAVIGLQQQARFIPRLVEGIPTLGVVGDTTWVLGPEIRGYLDGIGRDYLLVIDQAGRVIFRSQRAADLDPDALARLRALLVRVPMTPGPGRVRFGDDGEAFRYFLAPVDAGRDVRALLVAARPDAEGAAPTQLLLSMILVAPLILVASTLLGYWLAGRSLRQVDTMIEELGAVQDGRSLHRRLAVPAGQDELSRLAQTLNAMLGRVEQSFVALRRFTADASHELKTPLMVLRAGVERSLTNPRTPPEIVPALDETLRQINQMTELVTNLLMLARADEGRASLMLNDQDLRALLVEVGETAEILGEEQGLTVTLALPPGPVQLLLDPTRVRQLLMNLVTNAIKYTPAGGSVEVRLSETDATATVAVQDTGIGIAPGDLENVFERFWRADLARTRTGERPGTGLGLAIARWIVQAHGGTITAQSRPGRGSTFTVTFPKSGESTEGVEAEAVTDR